MRVEFSVEDTFDGVSMTAKIEHNGVLDNQDVSIAFLLACQFELTLKNLVRNHTLVIKNADNANSRC